MFLFHFTFSSVLGNFQPVVCGSPQGYKLYYLFYLQIMWDAYDNYLLLSIFTITLQYTAHEQINYLIPMYVPAGPI